MQSITTLSLNLQHPNFATTMDAVQHDRLTRKIIATLADGGTAWTPPTGSLGMIRFLKPDGTMGFYDTDENGNAAVTWTGNVATIMLVEQMLTVAGDVCCQMQFYNSGEERLSSFSWVIKVQQNVVTDETIESTDYFNVLTKRISDIMDAIVNPPQISPDGNWLLWDTEQNAYVDSGVSAGGVNISSVSKRSGTGEPGTIDVYQCNLSSGGVAGTFSVYNGANGARGATGDTGATGTPGVSMTGITKISGTGAGGTVDVYEVEMSDGQSGGTFNVYNGADGQGSPGSATPLMDGTAAVGTATAYAREDHVHPSDTSKVDKVTGKGLSTNDFTNTLKTKLNGIESGATANVASSADPQMDGTKAAGTSSDYSRADHVHPTDTSRQAKNTYFNAQAAECAISASAWTLQSTPTVSGFPYRANIAISGVTSSTYAIVTFRGPDVLSGNYAPLCGTHSGGVYIYSKTNVATTLNSIAIFW